MSHHYIMEWFMLLHNPSDAFDTTVFFPLSDEDAEQRLDSFFRSSLERFFKEGKGRTVYRIFVGRRCFVSAGKFIEKYSIDENIVDTVYSDGGMRVLAKRLAERYYRDCISAAETPAIKNTIIMLCDDILIHGRALGGLYRAPKRSLQKRFSRWRGTAVCIRASSSMTSS